jgi:hypothetical protein
VYGPPLGLASLAAAARLGLPLYALGGVDAGNAGRAMAAGHGPCHVLDRVARDADQGRGAEEAPGVLGRDPRRGEVRSGRPGGGGHVEAVVHDERLARRTQGSQERPRQLEELAGGEVLLPELQGDAPGRQAVDGAVRQVREAPTARSGGHEVDTREAHLLIVWRG